MKPRLPLLSALCLVASIGAYAQGDFFTYTGISGYWDYQTSYRTPQYLRVCPNSSLVHAIMMVSDDSLNPSTSRRTAYAFSSNGGTTWTTFSQIRVPPRRSGFPSLDIAQGSFSCAPIIASHGTVNSIPQSAVFVDFPAGSGTFTEIAPPLAFGGGDEPFFPEAAGAANGSTVLVGSRAAAGSSHITRTPDLISWQPWSLLSTDFVSDGYVAEGNPAGRVGIAIAAPSGPLLWFESTNNGSTWPANPSELLPELIPAGSDTFVVTQGLDLAYSGRDTLIAFGVTKPVGGVPTERFSGIGFFSRTTGFVNAVPHDSISGVIDALHKRQSNQNPVGYPAIGIAGTAIVIAFQAFRAETSLTGFNYSDIFLVYSTNSGRNWSRPRNITNTSNLDERYPSMSKWNAPGQANIVYQEDPQPGSAVFGGDLSPLARVRQRFCRAAGLPTPVEEESSFSPRGFALMQNYPNPFNPSTRIRFEVGGSGFVSLKVLDVLGREVATLANEELKPGEYEKTFDGRALAGGIYFYHLSAGHFSQTKKLVLLR